MPARGEARRLATSFPQYCGVLAANKTIKYPPANSVLKLQLGDEINVSGATFVPLFRACFAEIEKKFG